MRVTSTGRGAEVVRGLAQRHGQTRDQSDQDRRTLGSLVDSHRPADEAQARDRDQDPAVPHPVRKEEPDPGTPRDVQSELSRDPDGDERAGDGRSEAHHQAEAASGVSGHTPLEPLMRSQ